MERPAIEGDSPVIKNEQSCWFQNPSNTEHEKFCVNLPGPSGKAKYSYVTDTESEIEPETVCLQAVGAPLRWGDGVPFA